MSPFLRDPTFFPISSICTGTFPPPAHMVILGNIYPPLKKWEMTLC